VCLLDVFDWYLVCGLLVFRCACMLYRFIDQSVCNKDDDDDDNDDDEVSKAAGLYAIQLNVAHVPDH